MKITGTIVNKEMNLIGLVLRGKPSEFNMQGTQNWLISPFSLKDAKNIIHKNGCSEFDLDNHGKIVSKGNKKLSDLPMYDREGNIIDNKIKIKSTIEENGKLIGAVIIFIGTGAEKKLKLSDLELVYSYCEPTNFILKNRDNTYFITGKGDTKKEDIPVIDKTPIQKNVNSLFLCANVYYKDKKFIPNCSIHGAIDGSFIPHYCNIFDFVSYKCSGNSDDIEYTLKKVCNYTSRDIEKLGLDEKSDYFHVRNNAIKLFDIATNAMDFDFLYVGFSDSSKDDMTYNLSLFIKKLQEFHAYLEKVGCNLEVTLTEYQHENYMDTCFEPVVERACELYGVPYLKKSQNVESIKKEISLFMQDKLHDSFVNYLNKYDISYEATHFCQYNGYSNTYAPYSYTFKSNVYKINGKPFIEYHESNQKYPLGYFKIIE